MEMIYSFVDIAISPEKFRFVRINIAMTENSRIIVHLNVDLTRRGLVAPDNDSLRDQPLSEPMLIKDKIR